MNLIKNVFFLPIDLFRLTIHSWKFMLEGYLNRFLCTSPEQMCIFCQNLDAGMVPRVLSSEVKYKNLWLIRMLVPDIEVRKLPNSRKRVPVCSNEGGCVVTPGYTPLLAVGLLLFWATVFTWALCCTGMVPEEHSPFQNLGSLLSCSPK